MDKMNSRKRTAMTTLSKQRGTMMSPSRRHIEDTITSVGALLISAALAFLGLLAFILILALGF
jgi:hypothetical protein